MSPLEGDYRVGRQLRVGFACIECNDFGFSHRQLTETDIAPGTDQLPCIIVRRCPVVMGNCAMGKIGILPSSWNRRQVEQPLLELEERPTCSNIEEHRVLEGI